MSMALLLAGLLVTGGDTASTGAADADGQRVRCRKYEEIGSLVKKKKVCRTVAEWRKVDEAARSTGRTMQESGMGGPSPSG